MNLKSIVKIVRVMDPKASKAQRLEICSHATKQRPPFAFLKHFQKKLKKIFLMALKTHGGNSGGST